MSDTDHTSDPMGDDLDELLDAALDAAEASVADRFDAQRFDHRYGVERCEYGCAIALAEGTARELAQGMLTASLPVLLSDLRIAEARATAAEVASRGYRERAEKAEAERDAAWSVLPCQIAHDEPYDFDQCDTHDRTFPRGEECDQAGLSLIDYLTRREMEQRGRAVRAEAERDALADRAEKAEAALRAAVDAEQAGGES